jgi:nucleotide-binding universal stress UspA family protein
MRPEQTELSILHVVDLVLPIPTSYAEGFRQESLTQGKELVQQTEQLLEKAGYKVQAAVEEGTHSQSSLIMPLVGMRT